MRAMLSLLIGLMFLAPTANAGELVAGTLYVDGKPFFPLGGWDFGFTTPEDLDRLGMNTSFRSPRGTDEGVAEFREHMQKCADLGIEVVPYISYGGAGVVPWPPENVRRVAKLASEPNLLAWYVGDDITMVHLDGIKQTVNILREETPDIATSADYIADETPEAQTVFQDYVDIRCQYNYPIPNEPYTKYMEFFDRQREFVGDPLWTWVQDFMWGGTGRDLLLGQQDGPGPLPDPEQTRLLAHAALNRGVRGLLFFSHHSLQLVPEMKAEVALFCHEARLFNDQLAAGELDMDLPVSNPDLNAASYTYNGSVVVSAMVMKEQYHRWVDEAVLEGVTIQVPWTGRRAPKALLVQTPEVVECSVAEGDAPGTVAVTIPRIEVAGFILLTTNRGDANRLEKGVEEATARLAALAVPAAFTQTRKVAAEQWASGFEHLYSGEPQLMPAHRANERAADALEAQNAAEAVELWRETMRYCRITLDSLMSYAERQRDIVPGADIRFLQSPYSLRHIDGFAFAPEAGGEWNFVEEWMLAGPFQLGLDPDDDAIVPPGFERAYPPEQEYDPTARFQTVDGTSSWKHVNVDIRKLLDLRKHIATTDDVVAYARVLVVAPSDMTIDMSIGTNDGAKFWVNGEEVFSLHTGRAANPHMDLVPVNLKAGENVVLAKVENLGASWHLYLSFRDPNRVLSFTTE